MTVHQFGQLIPDGVGNLEIDGGLPFFMTNEDKTTDRFGFLLLLFKYTELFLSRHIVFSLLTYDI